MGHGLARYGPSASITLSTSCVLVSYDVDMTIRIFYEWPPIDCKADDVWFWIYHCNSQRRYFTGKVAVCTACVLRPRISLLWMDWCVMMGFISESICINCHSVPCLSKRDLFIVATYWPLLRARCCPVRSSGELVWRKSSPSIHKHPNSLLRPCWACI